MITDGLSATDLRVEGSHRIYLGQILNDKDTQVTYEYISKDGYKLFTYCSVIDLKNWVDLANSAGLFLKERTKVRIYWCGHFEFVINTVFPFLIRCLLIFVNKLSYSILIKNCIIILIFKQTVSIKATHSTSLQNSFLSNTFYPWTSQQSCNISTSRASIITPHTTCTQPIDMITFGRMTRWAAWWVRLSRWDDSWQSHSTHLLIIKLPKHLSSL